MYCFFFFSSRRRHTRFKCDWSSDVCSSDLDGGRGLAGAITSLMTGTSYKRSAELAAVVGPYDGFARNADAHKRVMRQHSDANGTATRVDDLDTPVWAAATEAWQDVIRLGEKNGF